MNNVSRAVALSGLITPVVRGAISVAPLHAMRANTAGTGKSFLVDVASSISSGRPCPVIAAGRDETETEKRLAGLLLAGFPLLSIDNVNGDLGGDLLCQAVERPLVRLRPLGASDIVEIECRATLFCTGNNLTVRGDMTRRTLVCDLDAEVERPELRKFSFDPVQTVCTDRGRYVSACLVIAGAYIRAGRPGRLNPIASFESWSDTVRSALVWLGEADPVDSMEKAREDDPELNDYRDLVIAWEACHAVDQEFTVKEIISHATGTDELADDARSARTAMLDILHRERIAGHRGGLDPQKLGLWLVRRAGRIAGGLRIAKTPARRSTAVWRLERPAAG